MAKVDVKNKSGKVVESTILPDEIFNTKTNVPLIHQVVTSELAAMRQGTHKVKTRGEVRGGGKKPYRQKGTGNARQGSIRAPQYAGGGVVHGPKPRDYSKRIPKKVVKSAIYGSLSNRLRTNNFFIIDNLKFAKASTKEFSNVITANKFSNKLLFITTDKNEYLSARNIKGVKIVKPKQINAYNVISTDTVLWTKNAIQEFVGERELQYTKVTAQKESPTVKKEESKSTGKKTSTTKKPEVKKDIKKPVKAKTTKRSTK